MTDRNSREIGVKPNNGSVTSVPRDRLQSSPQSNESTSLLLASFDFRTDISRARFWAIIAVILINNTLAAYDQTVLSTSHPVVSSYFQSSHIASWLTTSFMLANIAASPINVALADPLGRRVLMAGNAMIVLMATTWCALAKSMTSLICGRAVCGFGLAGSGIIGALMCADLIPIE